MPPPKKRKTEPQDPAHLSHIRSEISGPVASAQDLNPAYEREIVFHSLALSHVERERIIQLLTDANDKLAVLIDVALRSEWKPPP
jgi:hypothetical protein